VTNNIKTENVKMQQTSVTSVMHKITLKIVQQIFFFFFSTSFNTAGICKFSKAHRDQDKTKTGSATTKSKS